MPAEIIEECKRDILDSIGVAVAGIDTIPRVGSASKAIDAYIQTKAVLVKF